MTKSGQMAQTKRSGLEYHSHSFTPEPKMARKQHEADPDEIALIEWCTVVEELFVAAGVPRNEAQQFIEDEAEWLTDMFYDGLSAEEAAKAALA
jgi:hypothetical protein